MRCADTRELASVIVGSVNGGECIHVLLSALRAQDGAVPFEVIVADRCLDGTAERIAKEHPDVVLVRAEPSATLPELRTRALDHARGRFVLVTEDHTVPPRNWVSGLVGALEGCQGRIAAAGGPVDNDMRERAVDWAAFLCEYSGFLPPQPAGVVDELPGMNVAYRREHLDRARRELLTGGFWESTLHPDLLDAGYAFLRVPEVVIQHRKRFGFFYFLSQRYYYSRYFAGARFERKQRGRRLLYAVLSPLLALIVPARIARRVLGRPGYRRPFVRSLPVLACFALAWGAGEAVGYLAGPGDSLARIE